MQDAHARVSGSSDEESRPNLTFGQVTLQMPDKIIDALMPFSVSTITEAPWLAEPRSLSFSLPSGGEIALGNFRIRAVEESALQVCLWVEEGLPVLDLSLLSGAIVPVEFSAFAATSEIGSLGLLQLWSRTTAHVFDPLLDYWAATAARVVRGIRINLEQDGAAMLSMDIGFKIRVPLTRADVTEVTNTLWSGEAIAALVFDAIRSVDELVSHEPVE